ncbi:LysM peptidoglycan-binding domain-containing protein [Micromonospora sp. NPDC126480]|uniref:LysM peptidoglycan-binding domain-containing protein n=1 Tax=Micromonospora sp. NPDC126480 TaxID=3155312 RepID=UPI00331D9A4F
MTTPTRTAGRVLTGFGALVLLCALLVGAPVALLALAGNPLPDQVPTLAEVGTALTTRDDGQLFLRTLALAGWVGWATFALSVLVELGAVTLRRPAPRLPGMSRQQRAAAALVGSVALILAASPAAASAAALAAGPSTSAAGPTAVGAGPMSVPTGPTAVGAGPMSVPAGPTATAVLPEAGRSVAAGRDLAAPPVSLTLRALGAATSSPAPARTGPAEPVRHTPVYRVAKGDHLGSIAERYLDSFGEYPALARLNRLADPNRIHPGQLLRLPAEAQDRGVRPHATGRLVARPTPQRPVAPATPPVERSAPAAPEEPAAEPAKDGPVMTVGAARPHDPDRVNRPLAVSAILAVSSIIGAQIGAVLGLRRRPATAPLATTRRTATGRQQRELPAGRHRRD